MSEETLETTEIAESAEIIRHDEDRFNADMEALIKEAEDMRLKFMQSARSRSFMAMSIGLIAILLGAAGFGWFFLVETNVLKGLASIILGVVIAATFNIWTAKALGDYKRHYKMQFLPKMATVLGGFQYHPTRGISSKIISKTGVIPAHDLYEAEDCFMGRYKGVKVLFSEARLRRKKAKAEALFDGLFVLLEIPEESIEGHTILTANKDLVKRWRGNRWQKLQDVPLDEYGNMFNAFSDKPEAAKAAITPALLKELSEAAEIFDNSPLTAVMFRKKFIFLMIPHDADMFEASNIHVPVTTRQHALKCKREIEQLLEVIDVFQLYQSGGDDQSGLTPSS